MAATRTRKPTARKTARPVPTDVSEANVTLPSVPATLAKLADHAASATSVKPTTVNPSRGTTESTPALPFDEFATAAPTTDTDNLTTPRGAAEDARTPGWYRPARPETDTTPIRLANDRATPETDAEGPDNGKPGIVLDAHQFDVTIHNGYVTVYNPHTNNHRTFLIETVLNENSGLHGKRIVSLLTGPNREDYKNWKGFGFATGEGVKVWNKCRGFNGTKSEYEKFANLLENPRTFSAKHGLEYKIEAMCSRCGRSLTHPESIDSGMGPICRQKV